MANLSIAPDYSNVIQFEIIDGGKNRQNDTKPKKPNNKVAGEESEVYALRSREEIASVVEVFDKHIHEAKNDCQRKIANRNKMLFVIGINVGIRASDLRTLKWSFFFEKQNDGTLKFKDYYKFVPMKTSKQRKFVKINFNDAVRQVVLNYVSEYPIDNLDDYLFASRKGNDPITVGGLRKIIKDAAAEAGIEQNIGSHSLRKTFGKFCFLEAKDKTKALVVLQNIFNHSSTAVTMRYIGLMDEDMNDMFNSLNLGIDMI